MNAHNDPMNEDWLRALLDGMPAPGWAAQAAGYAGIWGQRTGRAQTSAKPLAEVSKLQYDALYALAERDSGDPQGLYYQLVSRLMRRTRMSREQVETQIATLAQL